MKKMIKTGLAAIALVVLGIFPLWGQEAMDTARIYYRQGMRYVDTTYHTNGAELKRFVEVLRRSYADSTLGVVSIRSAASPEGVSSANERLARLRSDSLAAYLSRHAAIPSDVFVKKSEGIAWRELRSLVAESSMRWKEEIVDIIDNTPVWVYDDRNRVVDSRKRQLMLLHGGKAWRYMNREFFPQLRSSIGAYLYTKDQIPEEYRRDTVIIRQIDTVRVVKADTIVRFRTDTVRMVEPAASFERPSRFIMALRTNLLYDVLAVPNLGLEFRLGRGWSVGASYMHAWWNSDRRSRYWRIYGGEIDVRKYFGSQAKGRPLSGHHLGLYGLAGTYDFEWGGTGYQSLLSYGCGLEYGYSLPIGRRLNIDFGIGMGYWGGEYKVYEPIDGHYVWQSTRNRHWFGPTKLEVSLVWILGGRDELKKGGVK